uniref:Uncharacterized protein n=1 Tax=candidate division WOR-3 bacterium TaxID=2052148 RepID=A0A7C4GG44_UNCW3
MARVEPARVLAWCAVVAAGLGLARLADAVGKRELARTERELAQELDVSRRNRREMEAERSRLKTDADLLAHRIAVMSKTDPYLVVSRSGRRLQLGMNDKVVFETGFRLRGPIEAVEAFEAMPRSTIEVLDVTRETDWFRPDWLYRLEGVEPPAESSARTIADAFGEGEVFLGGGIVIHGKPKEEVPPVAIDHVYLELGPKALRSVLEAVKPGSLVFIQ